MTPELWQRVCRALDEALALDVAARSAYLAELRRRDAEAAGAVGPMLQRHHDTRTDDDVLPTHVWDAIDEGDDDGHDGDAVTSLDAGPTGGGEWPAQGEWPTQIGPYVVEGMLARGGMGVVLRVSDEKFGRPLALKILAGKYRQRPEMIRRFRAEARLMGRLQHPGVPPVHDRGELEDGRPYLVMKLIKGRTLAELLRRGALPADPRPEPAAAAGNDSGPGPSPRLIAVFEQICQTIAYAHARGVIHRDLKPANVMVGAFGEVQVMDWGLAKVLGTSAAPSRDAATPSDRPSTVFVPPTVASADATTAGLVMGTPAYMAPEQARGEVQTLDERCDVFGLGGLLCEILTGQPPFVGAASGDTIDLAREGKISGAFARLDACGADRDLIEIAKSCLASARPDRPRDGRAVADLVVRYQAQLQERLRRSEIEQASLRIRAEEEKKRRRVRRLLTAVVTTFLALAVGAGLWYHLDREQREAAYRYERLKENIQATLRDEQALAGALASLLDDPVAVQELLGDPQRWQRRLDQRKEMLANAEKLLAGAAGLDTLHDDLGNQRTRLEEDQAQFQLAGELDDIHLQAFAFVEDEWNPTAAGPKYAAFFRERLGIDVEAEEAEVLTARVTKSPLRYILVAALDHWADVSRHPKSGHGALTAKLLQAARQADPDPWRDRFRQESAWEDASTLEKLAGELSDRTLLGRQSPPVLAALAGQLERRQGHGLPVLEAALVVHPDDFWINLTIANMLRYPSEKEGHYQAALAIRPTSSVAWNNRGACLFSLHKLQQALDAHQKAAQLDPRDWDAHRLVGRIRRYQGLYHEASDATRRALELLPEEHPFRSKVLEQLNECQRACTILQAEAKQPEVSLADLRAGISGSLTPDDPLEFYPLPNPSPRRAHRVRLAAGKAYRIDLETGVRRAFDCYLRIESDDGRPLAANDDVNPKNRNSRIVFVPDRDAVYRLVVNQYLGKSAQAAEGAYTLTLREMKATNSLPPIQNKITRGDSAENHRHYKRVEVKLTADASYVFELTSARFDPYLRIQDARGETIAFNDDVVPADFRRSRIDFTPHESGTYTLMVTTFLTGETGAYTLRIERYKPTEDGAAPPGRRPVPPNPGVPMPRN